MSATSRRRVAGGAPPPAGSASPIKAASPATPSATPLALAAAAAASTTALSPSGLSASMTLALDAAHRRHAALATATDTDDPPSLTFAERLEAWRLRNLPFARRQAAHIRLPSADWGLNVEGEMGRASPQRPRTAAAPFSSPSGTFFASPAEARRGALRSRLGASADARWRAFALAFRGCADADVRGDGAERATEEEAARSGNLSRLIRYCDVPWLAFADDDGGDLYAAAEDSRWRHRCEAENLAFSAGAGADARPVPLSVPREPLSVRLPQPLPVLQCELTAEDVGLPQQGEGASPGGPGLAPRDGDKEAMRALLLRWHSDKWSQQFGDRLDVRDAAAISARVGSTTSRLYDLRGRLLLGVNDMEAKGAAAPGPRGAAAAAGEWA